MPRPFDLEAAKRGEPIVYRDGTAAFFLGHFPDLAYHCQILVRIGNQPFWSSIKPEHFLMADPPPKKMRTVYVNFREDGRAYWHEHKNMARCHYWPKDGIAEAVPVEIPE